MTYRSDRDATRHRIAHLERELAEARANLDDAPATPPPRRRRGWPRWLPKIALVYVVVAITVAAAAVLVTRPDRLGWGYTALVATIAASVGMYFVATRKQWKRGVEVDLLLMMVMILPMLFGGGFAVHCIGGERETCRADKAAAVNRQTQFSGHVTSRERRDDIAVGAPCTLTVTSLYARECDAACTATLTCGDVVVFHGEGLDTCNIVNDEARVIHVGTQDQLGIRVTFDLATGRGGGFVYHDPQLGRLPWRVDIALAPSSK